MRFTELVDCIFPRGGVVTSIDYGGTFELLQHALTAEPAGDGVFIPPFPAEVLGFEDGGVCTNFWPACAGFVDWTSFVDFTTVAERGRELGWENVFYGPQSALEEVSELLWRVSEGHTVRVPGYSVLENAHWVDRHVQSFYGGGDNPGLPGTSFKVLIQAKRPSDLPQGTGPSASLRSPSADPQQPLLRTPSWHLDNTEIDQCWVRDVTFVPVADALRKMVAQKEEEAEEDGEDNEDDEPATGTVLGVQRGRGRGRGSGRSVGESHGRGVGKKESELVGPSPRVGRQRPFALQEAYQSLAADSERFDNIGALYFEGYFKTQLAARVVDWAVAKRGCRGVEQWALPMAFEPGAEDWARWAEVVDDATLTGIRRALQRRGAPTRGGAADPIEASAMAGGASAESFECVARQTLASLCPPGGAGGASQLSKGATGWNAEGGSADFGEAGSDEEYLRSIFNAYDADASDNLDPAEMTGLIRDLGMGAQSPARVYLSAESVPGLASEGSGAQNGSSQTTAHSALPTDAAWHMSLADLNADGKTDLSEFVDYNNGLMEYFEKIERTMSNAKAIRLGSL